MSFPFVCWHQQINIRNTSWANTNSEIQVWRSPRQVYELRPEHKRRCPRSDQRCHLQRRRPPKDCPRNWERFAKKDNCDEDYFAQGPVMIITSQWELGVWMPKGCVCTTLFVHSGDLSNIFRWVGSLRQQQLTSAVFPIRMHLSTSTRLTSQHQYLSYFELPYQLSFLW